ncbi:Rap1a/Tai family immunity protein [Rhizobium leguminosarum]|uniref:Rap1a/Tai family immunity protein n=1 Tax=Rhizobium leguminosarum TaxID=384 RepID=UPI003F9AAF54
MEVGVANKKLLTLAAAIITVFVQVGHARADEAKERTTVETFLASCELAKTILRGSDQNLTPEDNQAATYCMAYIRGFLDSWDSQDTILETYNMKGYPTCWLSPGVDQLRDMVWGATKYAIEHPEAKNSLPSLVTATMLKYSFCSAENVAKHQRNDKSKNSKADTTGADTGPFVQSQPLKNLNPFSRAK